MFCVGDGRMWVDFTFCVSTSEMHVSSGVDFGHTWKSWKIS